MRPAPAAAGLLAAVAVLGLAGILVAGSAWFRTVGLADEDDRPRVVTSVTIIADLAAQVGGDRVRIHSLLGPGQDPHTYEPVPRDALAFERADLVLLNGLDLDFWAERLARARGPRADRSGEGAGRPVVLLAEGVRTELLPWPGDPDKADPHLWMDPLLVIAYVEQIRDALAAVDPAGRDEYHARAAGLADRLRALDGWIRDQVATVPPERRLLVTTHDAYRYFGRRYGVRVLDTVWGITTEEEPSAHEIARLFRNLRDYRVPAFVETTINPQLMTEIAAQAGVRVGGELYADALGEPGSGADTYVDMMRHNVRTIVGALREEEA